MSKTLFFAVVRDDLTLQFINPVSVKNHLLRLKGQTVEMTIEKRRKHRSNEQNRYYHGVVLKMIADYCGYRGADEIEGLHEEFKRKFLPKVGRLNIVKSTSSLNTVEFSEYIESIRAWAAENFQLYIPDANEVEY